MVVHLAERSVAEKAGKTEANWAARLVDRMVEQWVVMRAAWKADTMGVLLAELRVEKSVGKMVDWKADRLDD